MKKKEIKQVDNPIMLGILLFLFLVSALFIIFNIKRSSTENSASVEENQNNQAKNEIQSDSLQEYFGSTPSSDSANETSDNIYLQTDPFRESCANSGAGENPSITFGTVCL